MTRRSFSHPLLLQSLLYGLPALWSSNVLLARLARGVIHPHAFAFGRWTLAFLLLMPFVGRGLFSPAGRAAAVHEWKHLLGLGALGMWICGAWVYLAGETTTATNIALIYAAAPVAISVASVKLLHEKMSGPQRLGVATALLGVLFIVARGDPRTLLDIRFVPGDLWAVAAAASWATYSVLLKRWPSSLGTGERLAAVAVGGLVVLLPFLAWETATRPALPIGGHAALLIVLAAVVPGALAYAAYSLLLRELGAGRTAILLYLSPIYSVLLAWLLLGEQPAWYHAAGTALILPSIWLATRSPVRPAGAVPS